VVFYLAKFLELVGISTVGFGLVYGLTNETGLRLELRMLLIGSAVFLLGRMIEGRGPA
jgi:hypothetical protein